MKTSYLKGYQYIRTDRLLHQLGRTVTTTENKSATLEHCESSNSPTNNVLPHVPLAPFFIEVQQNKLY